MYMYKYIIIHDQCLYIITCEKTSSFESINTIILLSAAITVNTLLLSLVVFLSLPLDPSLRGDTKCVPLLSDAHVVTTGIVHAMGTLTKEWFEGLCSVPVCLSSLQ